MPGNAPVRRGTPPTFVEQCGLPDGERDSGSVQAMVGKFASPAALRSLATAMTDTANVKRHNTSAWITSRISPGEYAKLPVLIGEVRCQHALGAAAQAKTQQRAAVIGQWLASNPDARMMDIDTLNKLAGSTGSIKIGWGGGDRFITLDGVGRVEALRQALAAHKAAAGSEHPLKAVESFGVRLTDEEFSQLHHASTYFLDEGGKPLESHDHDLMPHSALPRLAAGTAMNAVKQFMAPTDPARRPDRRLPTQLGERTLKALG